MEQKSLFKVGIVISVIGLVLFAILGVHFLLAFNNFFRSEHPLYPPPTTIIKSIEWDENTGQIRCILKYTGTETVTLHEVYANGTLDTEATIADSVLSQDQTTELTLSETYDAKPHRITVRVATSQGAGSFYKDKVFYEIVLKQVDWDNKTGKITVVVRNNGDETLTLNEIYVNDALDASALPHQKTLGANQEATVTLSETFTDTHTTIPIKVMTLEGISTERSDPIFGLWVQSINWDNNTGKIIAYIYDDGYEGITDGEISHVYVNGTLDSSATIHKSGNDFASITLSQTYPTNPTQLTIKVITSQGAHGELTLKPPNAFNSHPVE